MRFLGVGRSCDLGALYFRLIADGHAVKATVTEPLAAGTMAGMVPHVADWRAELDWVREAGRDGIILFESVAGDAGATQDALRCDGFQVIGGSAYGDRLENDRAYGQAVLADIGLPVAAVHEFDAAADGDRFVAANPARYVLKFNGPDFYSSDNHVGEACDGSDIRALLAARLRDRDGRASFVLMEHLDGVEMGVGAYFDGDRFLTPACLDWEHKRFFAGDMGELTGEMGTVATFDRTGHVFARTLEPMEGRLRAAGHVGYVNLNTIANERGIWPLEWTCRFGYPGFAILDPLQETSWAELFAAMATRSGAPFRTRPGFCVGVVLTTPPFPYTRHQVAEPIGLPVTVPAHFDAEDHANLHWGEVGLDPAGRLVTAGAYGWTAVVTGTGPTVADAKTAAYRRLARIRVPNGRYRLDIGDKLIAGNLAQVEGWGLFGEASDGLG